MDRSSAEKEKTTTHEPRAPLEKAPALRYRETHGSTSDWANTIRDNYSADLEPEEIQEFSDDASIPAAIFRGTGSFYDDLKCKSHTSRVRICDGTSCHLSGGDRVADNICRFGHDCERVSCLGHCDRSPVTLDDSSLECSDLPTEIRCLAKSAVITKHVIDTSVVDIEDARAAGIYSEISKLAAYSPTGVVQKIIESKLRGRGGAGFSAGEKWKAAARASADEKYVIANGDEGDPGSFIDRVLMEDDPHTIIEGMLWCGYAIGARQGIIYIRSEYPRAIKIFRQAISDAREAGFLGEKIAGSGFDFDINVFPGMGSYVCGEETALIKSIEGLRGEVQLRPPYPAEFGLWGKPTVVNNVEPLANIPCIMRHGAQAWHAMGTETSAGTKAICLNAGFARPGIAEVEFGIRLREIIEEIGGGGRDEQPLAAVLVGGPTGSIVLPKDWDLPLCYDELRNHNIE